MAIQFVAQQKMLGLSTCERLCGSWSREIEELASHSGWRGLPGERLSVSVGTAINMVVLSIGKNNGVELGAMGAWLPGLRSEVLLRLAEDTANWSFEGASAAERDFWPMLYGHPETVRPRIAPLLGCCSTTTTRQLRFHSQRDVESLSNLQLGNSGRTPRFSIDAHAVAAQVQSVCGSPLFIAKAASAS